MALHSEGDPHQGSYLDVTTHKDMLMDVVRTSAYSDAIRSLVTPGTRVIDFGSGTGVLAIFAARAGGSVDAIERTVMIGHAREIAARSGCPSIRFHHADHASFRADGPVDVIVSEWMGHAVFYESMLEPLVALRQRWLRPEGVMIPASISIACALVTDEAMYEDGSFLEHQPYGIDFGPIADLPLRHVRLVVLDEGQIASPVCALGTFDMRTIERTPDRLTGQLRVERAVTAFGLIVWFEAELAPGVTLGTGPHHPPTHWRQVFLPFPQPLRAEPTRPLEVSVVPPRDVENGDPSWAWTVSDGEQSIAVDERDSFARSGRL